MKRTFVYDKKSDKMVEVVRDTAQPGLHFAVGDFKPFVSPVDGSVVEGRRAYEEHCKRHNVIPFEAGSEKVSRPKEDRTSLREMLWETVDRNRNRLHRR